MEALRMIHVYRKVEIYIELRTKAETLKKKTRETRKEASV